MAKIGDAFVVKTLKEALASEHLDPLTEKEEQNILDLWNKQMDHNQRILSCGLCCIHDISSFVQKIPSAKFKNVAATQFFTKYLSYCRCFTMPHTEKHEYSELTDHHFLKLKMYIYKIHSHYAVQKYRHISHNKIFIKRSRDEFIKKMMICC